MFILYLVVMLLVLHNVYLHFKVKSASEIVKNMYLFEDRWLKAYIQITHGIDKRTQRLQYEEIVADIKKAGKEELNVQGDE